MSIAITALMLGALLALGIWSAPHAQIAPSLFLHSSLYSQRAIVVTDVNGNWVVSWAKSFSTAEPVIQATGLNGAASVPVTCNVVARTAVAASGKCWQTATALVPLLGLTVALTPAAFVAGEVMVIGLETTQ
jgi:hypothetical protein